MFPMLHVSVTNINSRDTLNSMQLSTSKYLANDNQLLLMKPTCDKLVHQICLPLSRNYKSQYKVGLSTGNLILTVTAF